MRHSHPTHSLQGVREIRATCAAVPCSFHCLTQILLQVRGGGDDKHFVLPSSYPANEFDWKSSRVPNVNFYSNTWQYSSSLGCCLLLWKKITFWVSKSTRKKSVVEVHKEQMHSIKMMPKLYLIFFLNKGIGRNTTVSSLFSDVAYWF